MRYIKRYNESISLNPDFREFCSKIGIKTGGIYYNEILLNMIQKKF